MSIGIDELLHACGIDCRFAKDGIYDSANNRAILTTALRLQKLRLCRFKLRDDMHFSPSQLLASFALSLKALCELNYLDFEVSALFSMDYFHPTDCLERFGQGHLLGMARGVELL